jgi:DNA-binding transcriptional LysR family regulator
MDIRQFRVLMTVLQTGSVSAAARTLNISQPAVSKTLAVIEEDMDLRLFERMNGRLVPTMQAHALCPDIDRILADFALIKQTARELRGGHRGRITIATPPTMSASVVPLAIKSFRRTHPSVEFIVTATTTPGVIDMVARNEAELGICQPSSGDVSVQATDLCSGLVMCIMPSGHELARRRHVGPADLADRDIISFALSEPTGARIAEAFRHEGLRLRLAADVNQSLTACAMVMAGIGVALVDSFLPIKAAFPGVVARPFSPAINLRIQLMTSNHRVLSPLAIAFRDELMTVARKWPNGGG